MSSQEVIEQIPHFAVVPVEIKNWSDKFVEPRYVKKTTVKTYIIDPTAPGAGAFDLRSIQIADYEPNRMRMVIQVVDQPVTLLTDPPGTGAQTSSASVAPSGRHLPASTSEYVLLGPDSFWLQAITGATTGRVTVTKEYC
jgi:hypothetical protein